MTRTPTLDSPTLEVPSFPPEAFPGEDTPSPARPTPKPRDSARFWAELGMVFGVYLIAVVVIAANAFFNP